LARAQVPGGARVLDQRVLVGAHAEWVLVADLLRVHEEPASVEVARELAVAVLDPAPGEGLGREPRVEAAVGPHGAERRHGGVRLLLAAQRREAALAEGGRFVHDAGPGVELDEAPADDAPQPLARRIAREPAEGRLVAAPDERLAPQRLQDLELAPE